jgi:FlaA1/EpsC-like NDP-sugar epimerase
LNTRSLSRNLFVIVGADALLLVAAWYAAHLVRFDFAIPEDQWVLFKAMLPLMLMIKLVTFYVFDLYRGMWRYTSVSDLINIIKAAGISSLLIVSFVLFVTGFKGFPRSVFILDGCFTMLFISAFRLSVRIYYEVISEDQSFRRAATMLFRSGRSEPSQSKNLLIIGAGDCGEKIYREIHGNARLRYHVVGFLDDDLAKTGMKIHGVPVLGPVRDVEAIARRVRADEALIAIPSANAEQMRRLVRYCKESGITFKTLPGLAELINGKVTVNGIREVAYRDLLGRDVIKLDQERIGATIQGKRVLVTGAAGSIGWELCRQVCRFRPESLVLYERAESPLYELELELKHRFQSVKIVPQLADIRDRQQLEKAFEASRPHVVFHAAAYKHVPMLELHPWKAVKNNICGTRNLIDVATKFAVERFVFVSTDKAVRPVNVMGATKRVAEMLVQGVNGHGSSRSRFITVRFGNVVGSAGSVVPLFRKQIAAGGPVTVTHPEVTRYFMTIPEACQLILQAGAMGEGREIFILDMGTPVKIDDMARDLIRLSGYEPGVDIKIEYIGLRPGEKLYEELITDGEGIVPTTHEKIMVLEGTTCNPQLLNGNIDDLARLAHDQDVEKIKRKLQEIVPEYEPSWLGLKWEIRTLEETMALETRSTEKSDERGQGGVNHVSLH